ncbi:MAG TPA: UDP-N-acetylglucosamine 2-epimerase (non-hydrolyzing) [Casimicrobiaceae bacterium]|nr:UDP-N-acetylglucosamine 2-epimerase (non-hydrolyzing) [Casimicrobiaceae bacterium]
MAALRQRGWIARGGSRAGDVLVVAGTRPECIKLAPVVRALARADLPAVVVSSGQHAHAVRATLAEFGLHPDVELAPLPALPNLAAASAHLRCELGAAIERFRPSVVIVQGDTLTAHAGALAARDAGCRLAHVEAGLRTPSITNPFPEEWFRRRIALHATWHFAPSPGAVAHLRREGVAPATIHCVGNPGIDSLRGVLAELPVRPVRDGTRVIVTLHRRENYDANADAICRALLRLADAEPALKLLLPVHPNPRIAARIRRRLGGHGAFQLVDPMAYKPFVRAAASAALIISDSGGIQEEAPHLGTPLLVPRDNTERPECLATGFVRLTPIDEDAIVGHARALLAAPARAAVPIDERAPFGDGRAGSRIASALAVALRMRAYA